MSCDDNSDARPASTPTSTSSGLLQRVRTGEPEAWRRLVRLYGPLVFLWCRRLGLPPDDEADVAQDVWAAVAKGTANFRRQPPEFTFRGWLFTLTRNKAVDWYRKSEAKGAGGTAAQQAMAKVPEVAADSAERVPGEKDLLVRQALELIRPEFEEQTWKAFWRSAVDGLPAVAVAAELEMTPGAVRQAKYRVLRRLRDEIEGLLE